MPAAMCAGSSTVPLNMRAVLATPIVASTHEKERGELEGARARR